MNSIIPSPGNGGVLPADGARRHTPPPAGPQPDPDTIDLREVIAVLRRHVWLVVAVTVLALASALAIVLRQQPQYRATATIRLKDERQAMTGTLDAPGLEQMLGKTVDPLLSQLEVMRSRGVAAEVARRTGLRLWPLDGALAHGTFADVRIASETLADTLEVRFARNGYSVQGGIGTAVGAYGRPLEVGGVALTVPARPTDVTAASVALVDEQEAIERLQDGLRASPLEKTDVVQVSFTDPDPLLARAVVNTAVQVFQEANASESQQLSRRRRLFVEEQLGKTDSVLADAQAALSEFRRREEVFSSRDRFAAQQSGMMELEMRREELVAERRVHARLLDALRRASTASDRALRSLMSAPGIAQNPVIGTQYQQLVRYQTMRDSLTTGGWGAAVTNPDVQRLDKLITNTRESLSDAATGYLATLDARIGSLDELKGRTAAGLQTQPDKEAEEMRLVQRVETASKLADQLREEYQKAQIAEAVEVGQVDIIDLAAMPPRPIGSGKPLKLALALMLGLMVGSGAAFLREHLNTSIGRKEELESLLGVPGLAVIPRITMQKRRTGLPPLRLPVRSARVHVERPLESLVTVNEERSSGAEAYRSLRTNLLFSHSISQLHSVMVTSPMASEGKTTTAANLAVAFAQQGVRVVLVDCDLRKARLHNVFGMSRSPGLTDVIAGNATAAEIVRHAGVPGLSIVTAGTIPPNPAELLGSEQVRELLLQLNAQAQLMIVDTPPVLVAGDASIVARMVDGAVLVVRAGQTERAVAQAAMQQLRTVGANVVGAVLNDPEAKVPRYDSYAYYAYHYYAEN